MKKILLLLFYTFVSCGDKETSIPVEGKIELSQETSLDYKFYADEGGSNKSVSIATNRAWASKITNTTKTGTDVTWLTLNPSSSDVAGKHHLGFIMKQNNTGEVRSAKIDILCGNSTVSFNIVQTEVTAAGENLGGDIVITKADLYPFIYEGGKQSLEFNTKNNWSVKIDEKSTSWLNVSPLNGVKGNSFIEITAIKINDTANKREGFITLTSGKSVRVINFSQNNKDNGAIHIPKAGMLAEIAKKQYLSDRISIKLTGEMNEEDIAVFKQDLKVQMLDISEVKFVNNKISGFESLRQLKILKLPEIITTLDSTAFNYCTLLTEVYFGENSRLETLKGGRGYFYVVGGLAVGAFNGCTSLTTINIPASVKTIEAGAFNNCESLSQITFESNSSLELLSSFRYSYDNGRLIETAQGLFNGCKNLKKFTVPPSVRRIGSETFKGAAWLEEIEIPASVISIDTKGLFEGCERLKNVKFESDIKDVGEAMFKGCRSIESLDFIKFETAGPYAFSGTGIKKFTAPLSMKTMSEGLLYECNKLETVELNYIQNIGKECFAFSENLKSIKIPSTVKIISHGAFSGCKSLIDFKLTGGELILGQQIFSNVPVETIIIPKEITSLTMDETCHSSFTFSNVKKFFFEEGSQCHTFGVCAGMRNITSLELPNSVKIISKRGFSETGLANITIPEGIERIESGAFSYCKKLVSVRLPSTLKYIENAFYRCDMLTTCLINGSDLVALNMFSGNNLLNEITIAKTLKSLDYYNEAYYYTNINTLMFEEGSQCHTIKGLFNTATSLKIIGIAESLEIIGEKVFLSSKVDFNLTTFPKLKEIGKHAFIGTVVKELYLPEAITIGEEAFSSKALKTAYLPKVKTISDKAFNPEVEIIAGHPVNERKIRIENNSDNNK